MNFMIFSTKGGTGKTRIAVSLAVLLKTETNSEVALLDFDTNQATAFKILELRNRDNPARPAPFRDKENLVDIKSILYDESLERLDEFMSVALSNYDHTVFDTGGYDSKFNRELLGYADHLILPIRPDIGDYWSLEDVIEIISEMKEQKQKFPKKVFVLLTQCSSHFSHKVDTQTDIDNLRNFIAKKGLSELVTVLNNRTYKYHVYSQSAVWGLGITESGNDKASDEFTRIVSEILNEIHSDV